MKPLSEMNTKELIEQIESLNAQIDNLEKHIDNMSCCCAGCTKHNQDLTTKAGTTLHGLEIFVDPTLTGSQCYLRDPVTGTMKMFGEIK